MYAKATLIWGIPLNEEAADFVSDAGPDSYGFEVLYSGCSEYEPGYIGVVVTEIDTLNHFRFNDLEKEKKLPSADQRKAVLKAIEDLDPEIKAFYEEKELVPDFWVIWHTS